MANVLYPVNSLDQNIKLMYRPPGRPIHINIVEALDEIYNKLDLIEAKLDNMEKNYGQTDAT